MKLDDQFVKVGVMPSSSYFTEFGVYKALMKSNKPIAEEFQLEVMKLLKDLRLK